MEGHEELHHVHHGSVAGEENALRKAPQGRGRGGAHGLLRLDRQETRQDRNREERDLLDPHARAPGAAPEPIDREERQREHDGRGLRGAGENERDPRAQEPGPALRVQIAHVGDEREKVEEGEEDVLPLGDPRHRLDVHRMNPEEERRHDRGPEASAREHPDEEKDQRGVREVEKQVQPVVGARVHSRDLVVQDQRSHRQRVVVPAHVGGENPVERGIRHEGVLGDVPVVVPIDEAVAEAGPVRNEGKEQDRPEPEEGAVGPGRRLRLGARGRPGRSFHRSSPRIAALSESPGATSWSRRASWTAWGTNRLA